MEQPGLTEEQRARAARNKQAALAKKQRKREQQSTAASAEAEDAEPARTRSAYANACALFGTQASQRSQDGAWTQPSQAPFVDVTNQPTRAETPARDDDDDAAPVRDDRDAALVCDGRDAAPVRDDGESVPARDDDASDDAAPVRIDDVKDDEEAADILVGASASDMMTYGDARRALALIRAAADAGPGPSINALPVLYHIAGLVTPERLLEICETRAAAIVSLQRTCHSDEDRLTERFDELLAAPEPHEDENASDAPDDADDGGDDADVFGAVQVDHAALLSQRPHDAQSLSQYANQGDADQAAPPQSSQDGLDLGEVRLTGFETSEAAAGQLKAVLAMQRKLAAAAAAKDEERRRHQAPVPAVHFARSPRARELFRAAEWLPPSPEQDGLLSADALECVAALPQLNPLLENELNVVDIEDWRAHTRFADRLRGECLTVSDARAMGLQCVSGATLVVSSDQIGRRRLNKERPRDEPDVRIVAVFLDGLVDVLQEAFGSLEQQRSVRRQADAAVRYGSSSVHATVKGHQGDMRGEGVRRMQTGLKNGGHHPLHTFAHKDGWERDKTYAADVVLNCAKVSSLEGFVAPRLSRYRLETRKAVGLPGLSHALGDALTAPAYFISRGYASPMHLDKMASCFPEAILWVKGKHCFDWQFAVPTASVAFSLNCAWPCFCLLQAANVLHGTLHTPGRAHDGIGLAAVSRDLLSSAKARAEVNRHKRARTDEG